MTAAALTLPELFRRRVMADPDRVAIRVDGRRELTFAEWDDRSRSLASGLLASGVRPAERIALLFDASGWIEYAIAYVAVHRVGAAAVHLSTAMSPQHLRYRQSRAGAERVIDHAAVHDLARGGPGPADVLVRPGDLADIAFTSGTTVDPKPIAVPHGNLTHGRTGGPDERLFPEEEVFLSAWAMGTNASQATLVSAITAHPTVLTTSSLDPSHLAALIQAGGAGGVMLPPSLAVALAHAGLGTRYDLSGVRAVGTGSAPVPPAIRAMLAQTFPNASIRVMYSSAEASPAFTGLVLPPWSHHRDRTVYAHGPLARSVGLPGRDTQLRIAGTAGEPQPPGRVGEIWLRSRAIPRAYDGDPATTARVFGDDGWIRTGDLGHVDAEGNLYIFDRAGEAVTSGGRRISTHAVEAAAYEHPAVLEAAAYGIADPPTGQRLALAIVPRAAVDEPELLAFLADRLDPADLPQRVRIMDALPRNLMGKVIKRELAHDLQPHS